MPRGRRPGPVAADGRMGGRIATTRLRIGRFVFGPRAMGQRAPAGLLDCRMAGPEHRHRCPGPACAGPTPERDPEAGLARCPCRPAARARRCRLAEAWQGAPRSDDAPCPGPGHLRARQRPPQALSLCANASPRFRPPATIATIAISPAADIPWRREALPSVRDGHDAGVIPLGGDPNCHRNPPHRTTVFTAVPVPLLDEANAARAQLLRAGENALVRRDPAAFGDACRRFADPAMRARIIRGGYRSAQACRIDVAGRPWAALRDDVAAAVRRRDSRPTGRFPG